MTSTTVAQAGRLFASRPRRPPTPDGTDAAALTGSFSEKIVMTPDAEDPFMGPPRRSNRSTCRKQSRSGAGSPSQESAGAAFGILICSRSGFDDRLVRDLFSRADWLGYGAVAVVAMRVVAFLIVSRAKSSHDATDRCPDAESRSGRGRRSRKDASRTCCDREARSPARRQSPDGQGPCPPDGGPRAISSMHPSHRN